MFDEIEEQIESFAMPSGPIGDSILGSINANIEEEIRNEEEIEFIPMLEAEMIASDGSMQEAGQAMDLEMAKFDKDGFNFNILDEIKKEMAISGMLTADSYSEDILEFLGESPESAFQKATGREWLPEAQLRDMVAAGELTDRERQSIVRQQTSFTDNLVRDVTEFAAAIPKMVTASANFVADVGHHAVDADSAALRQDLEKVMNIGGIALDEIAASGMAMMTRPASYFREQPLDFAGWVPVAAPVKAGAAVKAGTGALRKGLTAKEAANAGVKAFKEASTLSAIKGAGAVAAKHFESLPGGSTIAQATYNLYAGTPDEFKKIRDYFVRDKNRDIQWIEEKVLQPFAEMKKNLSVAEQGELYQALVGQLPNAQLRKRAARMMREGKGKEARRLIDEMDVSDDMIEWTYDGVPMTSSEFIFDTDIGKWNDDIIGARVHPDAPDVVKQNVDKLLDLKRKLFYEGRQQSRIKTNPADNLENPNFLSEDMFKALASSYLPIASMANKTTMDLADFFRNANKTARQQDSIGSLGAFRSDIAYSEPPAWTPPKTKKGVDRVVLSQENFIDALELSLPRTSDVMRRYKFYQELADSPQIVSDVKKKGFVKLDGGVALERLDEFGGDIMRYGALEGKYVPRNVARIIKSTERHIRDSDNVLRRAMQQHRRFLNLLKHNKLIANFSTHAHNMIGIWNILNMEGISFHEYLKNIKEFNKKWDDKTYDAFSRTGRMPKSARGFGDLNDVTDAISNVRSPREFWNIYMRKMENVPLKETMVLKAKGAAELGMQMAEYGSYRLLGLNGRMAKWYTATDRLARYTLFKTRLKKLAKQNKISYDKALQNKKLVDEASIFSSEAMLDYGDLPLGIQAMRETGFAPFIAYPYRATRYFIEYPLRKSKTYQATEGFRAGVEGADTPEERLLRRSIYPDDMQEPLGAGAQTLLGYDVPAVVSTRYWTPSPIWPRETLGMSRQFGEVPELMGEASATYADPFSSAAKVTGLPIPDTMTSKPVTDIARGQFVEAAEEILPPYFKKMSVLERALGRDVQDKLWGQPIGLKEKALQSVGMRIIPEENLTHARSRGKLAIKKLKGEPSYKKLSAKDKMKAEGSALTQASRMTLY